MSLRLDQIGPLMFKVLRVMTMWLYSCLILAFICDLYMCGIFGLEPNAVQVCYYSLCLILFVCIILVHSIRYFLDKKRKFDFENFIFEEDWHERNPRTPL